MRWSDSPTEGEQTSRHETDSQRQNIERRIQMAEEVEQKPERFVDQGIRDVPVRDLPAPDDINGPEDFKKVPYPEMVAGCKSLETMKPYIESGQGASSDYWRSVDEHYGTDPAKGYRQVYEAFYGDDAILLDKSGNSYDITNGRHRIFVAKQLGLETIPARVIEQQ